MRWLKHFYIHLQTLLKTHKKIVILGDFNIAPNDIDVHDPELWKDKVLCSENERRWLNKILDLGFSDSFRLFEQQEGLYSWWDYRAAAYRRKMGMRIDLVLVSEALKKGCAKSYIDESPRGRDRPSDHTPAVIELN
jgi:exodeoxyribonuclease-3